MSAEPVDGAAVPVDSLDTQDFRDPFAPPPEDASVDSTTITVVHHRSVPPPPPPPPQPRTEEDDFFVSGFGGGSMRITNASKKVGMMMGVRGGVLLGKRLAIGAAYYNLRRRFGPPILDDQDNPMALKMAYGGVLLGFTVVRHENLELNINSMFGAGMGCVSYSLKPSNGAQHCVESVRMFVAEPEAVFNVNVTDWMRLGFSLGYRFVAREKWTPPNNFNLSGAFTGLNFEFGWFGR